MELPLVLLLGLVCVSSAWAKDEEVLFDSTTFKSLNWDSFMATNKQKGWQQELHKENNRLVRFYSVCDANRVRANSWITTPGIPTNGSAHLWLGLKYSIKPCDDDAVPVCQLGVYYQELDSPSLVPVPLHSPWNEIVTLKNNETDTKATLVINEISTIIDINTNKPFISVGFQDNGSCTRLLSVRVFTRFCSNTTKAFATFRPTFALPEDQIVIGECVSNSKLAYDPKNTCTREGEWEMTTGGCKCMEGYSAVEDTACIKTSKSSQIKSETFLVFLLLFRSAVW